ncbi:hypothetical protein [Undibacterium sp. Di24W]|uniref:hypothetical protein n=1 Tax=Undibacterium sp. Di24W TaxID=3413033 RepID=UPI003BF06A37
MKKSSSITASITADSLADFMSPVVEVRHATYSMKPLKQPDWRAMVRPDGLTYRNEPSLMGTTRKLPNGEIV